MDGSVRDAFVVELRHPHGSDGSHVIGEGKSARRASLAGADLTGDGLRFADLKHCGLSGAEQATGLTWAGVRCATGTRPAEWPPGSSPSSPNVDGRPVHQMPDRPTGPTQMLVTAPMPVVANSPRTEPQPICSEG